MFSPANSTWIGAWIEAARRHKKWTQEVLAHEVGISKSAVSHWERGQTFPSVQQLLHVVYLTGYSLEGTPLPVAWPFKSIQLSRVTALTPQQLHSLEVGLVAALNAVEAPTPPPAPADNISHTRVRNVRGR